MKIINLFITKNQFTKDLVVTCEPINEKSYIWHQTIKDLDDLKINILVEVKKGKNETIH